MRKNLNDYVVAQMRVAKIEDSGVFLEVIDAPFLILWVPKEHEHLFGPVTDEYRRGYQDAWETMEAAYDYEGIKDGRV